MSPERARAAQLRDRLKTWLVRDAYPLWASAGLDPEGGFHERVGQDGVAIDLPRRARVQPRQVFCYAQAASLGFDPVASVQAVQHGLDFFLRSYVRPDGLVRRLVDARGAPLDDAADLYDQAFALLGFVSGYRALGRPPELAAAALKLKARLDDFAHPDLGYREPSPRVTPQQSDPHMHLFEVAMAWWETTGDAPWREMGAGLAKLALTRLIALHGGLGEYFDADWRPFEGLQGRILWPGHQFEWAWLLSRWDSLIGDPDAGAAARRLMERGMQGVDPERGVAFHAMLDDGAPHDENARLWSQCEWLRAAALTARDTGDDAWWAVTAEAGEALWRYLQTPVRGLWRDTLAKDGRFIEESAPASSFYHIVGAVAALDELLGPA